MAASKSSKLDKLEEKLDKEELKKALDISHFDINAILRGAQLTLVGGGFIALQGGFNFGVSGS